jgi:hypothetical protein
VRLERADINEWHSLLTLPPAILAIEAMLPLVAAAAIRRSGWSIPRRYGLIVLLLAACAIKVGRLDAFAQTAVAILLAPGILAGLDAFAARLRAPIWRRRIPGASLAIAGLLLASIAAASRMRAIPVEGRWIPDQDAARFLQRTTRNARLLTWFDWGEYAIWQLAPTGARVSIDGRRETVYSSQVVADHRRFYHGEADGLDYADRIGADTIWLPADTPVVAPLRARGWQTAFASARSVVLVRSTRFSARAPQADSSAVFAAPRPWPQ